MDSKQSYDEHPKWEQIVRSLEKGNKTPDYQSNEITKEEMDFVLKVVENQELEKVVESLDKIDVKSEWSVFRKRFLETKSD